MPDPARQRTEERFAAYAAACQRAGVQLREIVVDRGGAIWRHIRRSIGLDRPPVACRTGTLQPRTRQARCGHGDAGEEERVMDDAAERIWAWCWNYIGPFDGKPCWAPYKPSFGKLIKLPVEQSWNPLKKAFWNPRAERPQQIVTEYVRADLSTFAAGMRAMREAAAEVADRESKRRLSLQTSAGVNALRGTAAMHGQVSEAMRVTSEAIRAIPVPEHDPVAELVRAAKALADRFDQNADRGMIGRWVEATALRAALAKMEGQR